MGGKQSGHNDISPTKLNSIHHKVVINTNRVERIDSTDSNTMMLMMISMMPVTMMMAMVMISPSGR